MVSKLEKSEQLQLRVSAVEKKAIFQAAKLAGLGMSEYVLDKVLPKNKIILEKLIAKLAVSDAPSYEWAAMHDLFSRLSTNEFAEIIENIDVSKLSLYFQNYLAAMIELAAVQKKIEAPAWLSKIKVLNNPVFGSELKSLRFYLLTNSPLPFRMRNIFIDASIGSRV